MILRGFVSVTNEPVSIQVLQIYIKYVLNETIYYVMHQAYLLLLVSFTFFHFICCTDGHE